MKSKDHSVSCKNCKNRVSGRVIKLDSQQRCIECRRPFGIYTAKPVRGRTNNITGKKFGKLKVESFSCYKNHKYYWNCVCDCGGKTISQTYDLITGSSKSCGCEWIKKIIKVNTKHGMRGSRFYYIWRSMKFRGVGNTKNIIMYYKSKGIKVCDRWQEFENFKEDMYDAYLKHAKKYGLRNTTIDRIDGNGHYEPKNCRWATRSVQVLNRSVPRPEHLQLRKTLLQKNGFIQSLDNLIDKNNL